MVRRLPRGALRLAEGRDDHHSGSPKPPSSSTATPKLIFEVEIAEGQELPATLLLRKIREPGQATSPIAMDSGES